MADPIHIAFDPSSREFAELARTPFDQLKPGLRLRVYGVQYVPLECPGAGRLYVTRHGWPLLGHLLPSRWHEGGRYRRQGWRLAGSTGTVYRVPVHDEPGRRQDLVVKFSRFAQDVPFHVKSTFPASVPRQTVESARFNNPFEEFGLVTDLRSGRFGPSGLRILTKRPLAIYQPRHTLESWQLGRSLAQFSQHQSALLRDQLGSGGATLELDFHRQYIMLFGWVRGRSAEEYHEKGLLSDTEMRDLTTRVAGELADKGFHVLDNKPKHFILRRRRDGSLLRRHGRLAYVLVDFELLQRTPAHEAHRLRLRQDRAARDRTQGDRWLAP